MHTFFINTSERISSELYHNLLFEKLITEKELLIPNEYVPIGSINEYASELAAIIDQEADVSEDVSLIVFIDNDRTPVNSQDEIRSKVLADETLYSIKAEAALIRTLSSKGKCPKELIFVFGERIKRNKFLAMDDVFHEDMQKRMWETVQLPSCENLLKGFLEVDDDVYAGEKPVKEVTYDNLLGFLLSGTPKEDDIITANDTECYHVILENTAQNIMYFMDNANQIIRENDLYRCLSDAVDYYLNINLRNELLDRYAVSVRYMYLPMEYKDFHEIHRSICRLMLYVYSVSYSNNHPGLFDMSQEQQYIDIQKKDNGILFAGQVPSVDYAQLSKALRTHAERCYNSVYRPALPPQDLNDKVEREETLIISQHPVPQLVPEDLFDQQQNVNLSVLSSLIPDKLKKVRMRVSALKRAVAETYSSILEKNRTNQDEIIRYLNRAASEYDRIKDDALRSIPITDNSVFTMDPGSTDAEKKIDDLKNMENDLHEKLIRKEQQLLQTRQQLVTAKDVSQLVEDTRHQTDYYFKSLKRSFLLIACCVFFILAALIPYVIIMNRLFTIPEGYLFFIVTGAVCIASLIVGYEAFSRITKHKIIDQVRDVMEEFAYTQQNNQDCLNHYTDYLYKLIPGYYAEKHYERLLHNYKTQTERRLEQIAYHDKSRKQRLLLIDHLLDNLDCQSVEDYTEDDIVLTIDPEKDRIENGEVYILSADEVNSVQIRGKEQNDE